MTEGVPGAPAPGAGFGLDSTAHGDHVPAPVGTKNVDHRGVAQPG